MDNCRSTCEVVIKTQISALMTFQAKAQHSHLQLSTCRITSKITPCSIAQGRLELIYFQDAASAMPSSRPFTDVKSVSSDISWRTHRQTVRHIHLTRMPLLTRCFADEPSGQCIYVWQSIFSNPSIIQTVE
jgi:hypothetical protein